MRHSLIIHFKQVIGYLLIDPAVRDCLQRADEFVLKSGVKSLKAKEDISLQRQLFSQDHIRVTNPVPAPSSLIHSEVWHHNST